MQEAQKPQKTITIDEVGFAIKEDELKINVCFSLHPSRIHFSKLHLDLFFQNQLLTSPVLSIPQGALATDTFEFPSILDMKGIAEGQYLIKVEIFETWQNEKFNHTQKDTFIQYVPVTRAARLVKIPTVKSVAGNGLSVVLPNVKGIYAEMTKESKKEALSKRDKW
ncbi:MAG: hypothetical protein NWF01_11345 [Candidatus Bathyarchaeota archaeon]|nr:hypothetical protein [Candidatus Bathyarchaeota archaeon]